MRVFNGVLNEAKAMKCASVFAIPSEQFNVYGHLTTQSRITETKDVRSKILDKFSNRLSMTQRTMPRDIFYDHGKTQN